MNIEVLGGLAKIRRGWPTAKSIKRINPMLVVMLESSTTFENPLQVLWWKSKIVPWFSRMCYRIPEGAQYDHRRIYRIRIQWALFLEPIGKSPARGSGSNWSRTEGGKSSPSNSGRRSSRAPWISHDKIRRCSVGVMKFLLFHNI